MSPATELPELPEGYFWRIGDKPEVTIHYARGGSSSYHYSAACVMLMRRTTEAVTEHVPVYGDRWWNRHKVVSHDTRTEMQEVEREVSFAVPSDLALLQGEAVPEFGIVAGSIINGGETTILSYSVPIDAEGLAYTAGLLLERHRKAERQQEGWRREVQARDEAKEKFYGDYPPKTLDGVQKNRTERAKELFYADPLASKVLDWEEVGPRVRDLYWRKADEEADRG